MDESLEADYTMFAYRKFLPIVQNNISNIFRVTIIMSLHQLYHVVSYSQKARKYVTIMVTHYTHFVPRSIPYRSRNKP